MDYVSYFELATCGLAVIGIIIAVAIPVTLHHLKTHDNLLSKIHNIDKKQVQIDTLLLIAKDQGEKISDNIYQQERRE